MPVQISGPSSTPPGSLGSRVLVGTSGGSGGAHRYWRIYVTATAGTYPGFSEIELRSSAGGSDLTGSGTASASAVEGGNTAASAVDDNTSTFWGSYPGAVPQWWAYDFGSGVSHAIIELRITPRQDIYWNSAPDAFLWQYSDDGSVWTTQGAFSVSWASNAAQTISVVPITTYTYGVKTSDTGRYLNLAAASLPVTTAWLELWAQSITPGAASYTRLLLTGSTYGTFTEAGRARFALGAVLASDAGSITRQPMVTIV